MTPERWRQIEDLYHAVLEHASADRTALLAKVDPELRREIEAMLAQDASGKILDRPAKDLLIDLKEFGNDPGEPLIGQRLGPYHILSLLGAGGMGQVYRARDSKLKREVAIKVLPDELSRDPDRVSRFQIEAEVLASLNHPHIAAIYDLAEIGGSRFLILELVEGATLAERIAQGPIPLEEVLPIAKQIADALEYAHEHGVMHRDLKPANIKLKPDGTVKVLDFGLAKVLNEDTRSPVNSNSPIAATQAGVILGTAAYMSPEQATGKEVDRRADIWAFGCVLFEMLAGKHPFASDDTTEIMAAILRDEPAWTAVPSSTPSALRKLLQRCLKKDPKQRLQAMGDARIEISELLGGSSEQIITTAELSRAPMWQRGLPWALATAALAASAMILILWAPWRKTSPQALMRMSAEIGIDASIPVVNTSASLTLSADGSLLAFTAVKGGRPQLYVRRLGQLQSTPVVGTTGARDPFFSPDGQWIAFFADGKLKKVPVTGSGAAIVLCDAGADRGGTWTEDHAIVFQPASNGPLFRVPDSGGKAEPLITLGEGEFTQRWPQMLPGGKAVLYTAHSMGTGFENANVVVRPLPNGSPKTIQSGGYFGRYLASGHLVYIHNNTLFAVPFDGGRMELTGSPVQVLENVAANPNAVTPGAAAFAASETGTAVYLPNQQAVPALPIEWLDRAGNVTPLRAMPSIWGNPHLAPDGRQIAFNMVSGGQQDVWVYEWARETLTRLTSDGSHAPIWSPDGRRIVFRSDPASGGAFNLYWKRADGSGAAQRLTESKNAQFPGSWHPSGKFLAFFEINPQTGYDVMILPMEGDETSGWKPGKPASLLNTPATETAPMFSPDGRWLAYQSNESGRTEVYVQPFPGRGGKWQISTQGGAGAVWSRGRHELFFGTPDNRLMVVSYTAEADSFHADKPRPWSDKHIEPRGFDLHPDGERMALAVAPDAQSDAGQANVVFIFNFLDELRRIAPPSKK